MKIDEFDYYVLKECAVIVGGGLAIATVTIALLSGIACGISLINNTIDDNIKYNRYNEALQEYKKCAKDFTDSFDARVYCGDAPSSTMML